MAWSNKRSRKALRLLGLFGRQHRRPLVQGLLGTIAVVIFRIAMPWPLRGVIEVAIAPSDSLVTSPFGQMPAWGIEMFWLGAAYVGIAAGMGFAEMRQRVSMKKFASRVVRDMREAGLRSIVRRGDHDATDTADLISRVVGDSARIKAELSGILVHASQNGLLFLGICLLFLYLSPKLGLFFLLGGLFAIVVGYRTTRDVASMALKQRKKEGNYAGIVQEAIQQGYVDLSSKVVNKDSARQDVRTTRLITRSTWIVHVGLSIVTAVALWVAVYEVQRGTLLPGELFLFIAYVLTIHRRMVQVGRQLARSGKLVANISRLGALINRRDVQEEPPPLEPLSHRLELRDVRLRVNKQTDGRKRHKDTHLVLYRGTKTAVIGHPGAGKSTLLSICAGQGWPKGKVLWDGQVVTAGQLVSMPGLRFLPQSPVFKRRDIASFVRASDLSDLAPYADLITELGLKRVLKAAPKGLQTKVSSSTVTREEARSLVLFNILTDQASTLWILDAPLEGLSEKKALKRLETILDYAGDRTLMLSLSYPLVPDRFEHILVMKDLKPVFDGPPASWRAWKQERKLSREQVLP